jgi:broad specificity phosphatase PhoE
MKNFLFLLIFSALSFQINAQKPTIIYLVRHAEKVTTDPTNKDPLLTEKGQKRALDLSKKLKKQKLSAIYCTDYQRIKLTAQPIADKRNIAIQIYDPKNLKGFAEKVLLDNKGNKVLIVGHSNTVLETIEALGGKKPIATILDNEYDYFFNIKILPNGVVEVEFERYGDRNERLVFGETMKGK